MTQAYPGASATRMSQDFPVLLKTENLEKVTQVPVSFLLLQKYTGGERAGGRTSTRPGLPGSLRIGLPGGSGRGRRRAELTPGRTPAHTKVPGSPKLVAELRKAPAGAPRLPPRGPLPSCAARPARPAATQLPR